MKLNQFNMQFFPILTSVSFLVTLTGAGPCPFKMMQSSGAFEGHGSKVAEKFARDPEWIPAMDPDFNLVKREAAPQPEAEAEPQSGGTSSSCAQRVYLLT